MIESAPLLEIYIDRGAEIDWSSPVTQASLVMGTYSSEKLRLCTRTSALSIYEHDMRPSNLQSL